MTGLVLPDELLPRLEDDRLSEELEKFELAEPRPELSVELLAEELLDLPLTELPDRLLDDLEAELPDDLELRLLFEDEDVPLRDDFHDDFEL